MKAWIVRSGYEWITLVHAPTRGKAKQCARTWIDDANDFVDIRAIRFPELDNKPFTYIACKEAGFEYEDDSDLPDLNFRNDCYCSICKNKVLLPHI